LVARGPWPDVLTKEKRSSSSSFISSNLVGAVNTSGLFCHLALLKYFSYLFPVFPKKYLCNSHTMAPKRKGSPAASVDEQLDLVLSCLKSRDNGLDSKLKNLLQKLAPIALKDDIITRHPYQDEVVSEIEDALMGMERQMKEDLEEAVTEAEGIEAKRQVALDALEAASNHLADCEDKLEKAGEAVVNAEHDVETASQAIDVAKKSHKESDKTVAAAQKAAENIANIMASFKKAADEGPDAEGVGDLKTLGEKLEKVKEVASSLAKAVPTVLRKVPSARAPFDQTVVTQMNESLTRALARAEEDKHAAEEAASSGENQITELGKVFEGACNTLAEMNVKRNEAADAKDQAETAKAEAEDGVDNFVDESNNTRANFEGVEETVADFYQKLSAFRYLQTRFDEFEPPRDWSPCRPSRRPGILDEPKAVKKARAKPAKKAMRKSI